MYKIAPIVIDNTWRNANDAALKLKANDQQVYFLTGVLL